MTKPFAQQASWPERASTIERRVDAGISPRRRLVRRAEARIELARRPDRRAAERVGVGREREGNQGELLDRKPGCHRDRCQLSKFDGPLTHDVAAEDGVSLSIGDELAEPRGPTVDDGARQ